jgi:hypothetical protein
MKCGFNSCNAWAGDYLLFQGNRLPDYCVIPLCCKVAHEKCNGFLEVV